MKLVSACLAGINCKYDGRNKCIRNLKEELKRGNLIPLCPEQLGGLPTPRSPSGILNGVGKDVISGKCRIINKKGEDVTKQFLKGVKEVMRIVKLMNITEAILKRTSPCCGVGKTWQMSVSKGKYKNTLVSGDGVLTALLTKNKIKVLSESDLSKN
jgi:uncharacterized protein YbbK (DUF523 family)